MIRTHLTIDGARTTATLAPYLVALVWGSGVDSIASACQAIVDDEPELWAWSADWGDSVSSRLAACLTRRVADPMYVEHARVFQPAAPLEPQPWARELGRVAPSENTLDLP